MEKLKAEVYDIQVEQEKLLIQIQPVQDKLKELQEKKIELIKQIND